MDSNLISERLRTSLPACEIQVEGGGGKFLVTAVGDVFAGLGPVKRQQKIYSILNDEIASGAIHAVTMRLYTVAEFAATKSASN